MTCAVCGRDKVWHGSEVDPPLSEIGCHDGVRMDDDEHGEGWQPDVIYPPCPHSPLKCATCNGTGACPEGVDSDSDDCPACQGTGWKNGEAQWPVEAEPAPTEEFAWVIEHGESEVSAPRYWAAGQVDPTRSSAWTQNHEHAIRFARKLDAERVAERTMKTIPVRIAEHGWG